MQFYMKIEKLTDNKIRIILNIDDLVKKNIDVQSLIKNTNKTHIFFEKLLKQAQKEVDFNTDDSQLLIEAFISSEGFFILTFTKISNKLRQKKLSLPKVKRKLSNPTSTTAIYQFSCFEDYCNFCTYVSNTKLKCLKKFAKYISLYEYNSKYFLVFSCINLNYEFAALFYTSISEFAKLASNSAYFKSMLVEYGKVIFKNNAIEKGISLNNSHIN